MFAPSCIDCEPPNGGRKRDRLNPTVLALVEGWRVLTRFVRRLENRFMPGEPQVTVGPWGPSHEVSDGAARDAVTARVGD